MYANRKKWDLQRVEIDLSFEKVRAAEVAEYDGDAKFVHKIHKDIRLFGNLDDAQRERLMEIATKCPVNRILQGPTWLTQEDTTPTPEEA
jgi:putative redox protein